MYMYWPNHVLEIHGPKIGVGAYTEMDAYSRQFSTQLRSLNIPPPTQLQYVPCGSHGVPRKMIL